MPAQASKRLSGPKTSRAGKTLKILLVDNNVTDCCLFEEAFCALRIRHELQIARDDAEAFALLKVDVSSRSLPALIVLDVNIPKGFRFLRAIRRKPKLRAIPIIVLTSSDNDGDVHQAYEHGASAYVCKPLDDFVDLVGDIDRFWLRRARLPLH